MPPDETGRAQEPQVAGNDHSTQTIVIQVETNAIDQRGLIFGNIAVHLREQTAELNRFGKGYRVHFVTINQRTDVLSHGL